MSYNSVYKTSNKTIVNYDPRLRILWFLFLMIAVVVVGRLFILMVFQHSFYEALAAGSHDMYSDLFPKRGNIYIQDSRTREKYPLAMNRDYFLVYADTREIKDDNTANEVVNKLAEIFGYNNEKKLTVFVQINKRTDPYEPLEKKVDEVVVEKIKQLNLPGINFVRNPFRYYPEDGLAAQVVGFLGKDKDGNDIGHYGVEGYWQKELAGKGGFLQGEKSAVGSLITLSGRNFEAAEDGSDILLTIDRTIQFKACSILNQARIDYGAVSASLIIMDPYTGAIRAMCSSPDFNPNIYSQVESADFYNNTNIFTPYEPGSIFKPIVMAAAINEGVVIPETIFNDSGSSTGICDRPIKNAEGRAWGRQTMSQVIQNSVNTGMVFVAEKLGKKKLVQYIKDFSFGIREGLELDSEVSGNIDTLGINKGDKIDCYGATASFGQGITATPLQMITAFGAIANGGILMKPFIVEEIQHSDGRIEKFGAKEIRKVLEKRTSLLLGGMLVNVIDSNNEKGAAVKGYYVAGKTGTAQIPGPGGYIQDTNHSFIGFAPVDNPKFVMLVKFEKPKRKYASATASPVFGDVAKFLLQYYQVPPAR